MKKIVALAFMSMLLVSGFAAAGGASGVNVIEPEKGEVPEVLGYSCPPIC